MCPTSNYPFLSTSLRPLHRSAARRGHKDSWHRKTARVAIWRIDAPSLSMGGQLSGTSAGRHLPIPALCLGGAEWRRLIGDHILLVTVEALIRTRRQQPFIEGTECLRIESVRSSLHGCSEVLDLIFGGSNLHECLRQRKSSSSMTRIQICVYKSS